MSRVKTWRESDNRERLFEVKDLPPPPTIDHLFGRDFISCDFISFENRRKLLISPAAHEDSVRKMGIITDRIVHVGGFVEPRPRSVNLYRTENENHRFIVSHLV
ncbi:MAG TPA: hypothetical protein VNZ64_08690 [Candidatus Acidoferrum sp.]|jgi:putative restriction endonuclease|nr:hypothetical protein [Candidatus Acidoferrum sp.]